MNQVLNSRFSSLVKRLLATKVGNPGAYVGDGIAPSMEVNDPYQPELRAARGERLFTVGNVFTNTAATNFGYGIIVNALATNRVFIIKRVLWSTPFTTAAGQPGLGACIVQNPVALTTSAGGSQGHPKDSRVAVQGGQQNNTVNIVGVTGAPVNQSTQVTFSSIYYPIYPSVTAVPQTVIIDNVDVCVWPGGQVGFQFIFDTQNTITYNWQLLVEGFERVIDPNELLLPLP